MNQLAVCHTCRLKHLEAPGSDEAIEFFARHKGHHVELQLPGFLDGRLFKLRRLLGVDLFRELRDGVFRVDRLGIAGYGGNANVKVAPGTATAFTKTNANLATSATAGWQSNSVDNTSNLYDDYLIHSELAAVNTAPANSKAIFQYAFALVDDAASAYTSTGDGTPSGTEGTLTFPDVTTLPVVAPLLGITPYPVQNKAINGGPFSFASALGLQGMAPTKLAIGMVNHSGMTLSVTDIKYRGFYFTVA